MRCSRRILRLILNLIVPGDGISVKGETFQQEEMAKFLNIEDVLNSHPITCHLNMPFQRVYSIFVKHGLRHLVVLSSDGEVQGIITRSNIYHQASIMILTFLALNA